MPRQAKKLEHKATQWVGAKEEHQIISKDETDALNPTMYDPMSKSKENKDTTSKKQDVNPHDHMKEEVVIPSYLDQEASKNPNVAPQDSLEKYYSNPSDLA